MLMPIVSAIKSVDFTDSAACEAAITEADTDDTNEADYVATTGSVARRIASCEARPDLDQRTGRNTWTAAGLEHCKQRMQQHAAARIIANSGRPVGEMTA